MSKTKFKPVEEQLAYLKKGTAEIIPEAELKAKLEHSFKTGAPLRVYLGVDPTAPDIHLGHTVVLRKLKHFQDLGHTAIFLIGDFSAMIGDPTGRSETRPPLSREEVSANAETYLAQVFKLLDPQTTEVRYNSEWLDKLSSYDIVRICGHYSLARMLEREDFRSRLEQHQPISVHELLYPLLTAYDAVALKSDVELGATEQKFNILVHRDIQRAYGLPGEVAVTMPIFVGLDGQRKMSKSLGNYIGITEPPNEMFGKMMSISDELMWAYYELLTDRSEAEIQELRQSLTSPTSPLSAAPPHNKPPMTMPPVPSSDNPRSLLNQPPSTHPIEIKMELAREVVSTFHGEKAGRESAEYFRRVFRERLTPVEMKEMRVVRVPGGLMFSRRESANVVEQTTVPIPSGLIKWSKLLADLGEVSSTSEAERVMKQNGFEVDGRLIVEPTTKLDVDQPRSYEVRIGKKKFLRIIIES